MAAACRALNDLVSGQIQIFFGTLSALTPQIKANRIRSITVKTAAQSNALLQTTFHANAGRQDVALTLTLTLTPRQLRDHGPAELRIKTVSDEVVVPTYYNHDTLQDEAAASWYFGWVDGDLWPDVIIETNARVPATFVVRSSDGSIREMPAH